MPTGTISEIRPRRGRGPAVLVVDDEEYTTFDSAIIKSAQVGVPVTYTLETRQGKDGRTFRNVVALAVIGEPTEPASQAEVSPPPVIESDPTEALVVPLAPPPPAEPLAQTPTRTEFKNEFDVSHLLATVTTLTITDTQKNILLAPVPPELVEIRPDGLIYLPWMEYASRLTQAFPLAWALIPQGMPKIHENAVAWGFWLIIKGTMMGFAIGEQAYIPSNPTMGYTDATEGAKSNALMRLCKGLGLGLELWQPTFINAWKQEYAETYTDRHGKLRWRKKTARAAPPHVTPHVAPQGVGSSATRLKFDGEYVTTLQEETDSNGQERQALLSKIRTLSERLKLPVGIKTHLWEKYCGNAKPDTANLAGLNDLLSALQFRSSTGDWPSD